MGDELSMTLTEHHINLLRNLDQLINAGLIKKGSTKKFSKFKNKAFCASKVLNGLSFDLPPKFQGFLKEDDNG